MQGNQLYFCCNNLWNGRVQTSMQAKFVLVISFPLSHIFYYSNWLNMVGDDNYKVDKQVEGCCKLSDNVRKQRFVGNDC